MFKSQQSIIDQQSVAIPLSTIGRVDRLRTHSILSQVIGCEKYASCILVLDKCSILQDAEICKFNEAIIVHYALINSNVRTVNCCHQCFVYTECTDITKLTQDLKAFSAPYYCKVEDKLILVDGMLRITHLQSVYT